MIPLGLSVHSGAGKPRLTAAFPRFGGTSSRAILHKSRVVPGGKVHGEGPMIAIRSFVFCAAITITAFITAGMPENSQAGPKDSESRYSIGLEAGDFKKAVPLDSNAPTVIAFEDAKKVGLLKEDGTPTAQPGGMSELGGATGGKVKVWRFDKVPLKLQPVKANGDSNGDQRMVEVQVFVPKRPADQDGANDAEKMAKTKALPTLIGVNVVGMKIGGGKLELVDEATNKPDMNNRSTKWSNKPGEEEEESVLFHLPLQIDGFGYDIAGVGEPAARRRRLR